jgi:hypothetical protein
MDFAGLRRSFLAHIVADLDADQHETPHYPQSELLANIGGSINPGLVGGLGIWSRPRPTAVLYAVNCFNDFPTLLTSIAVIRIC